MLPLILFFLWIYVLFVFKKNKLYFFYFINGCTGFFIFSMYWGLKEIRQIFSEIVIYIVAFVGRLTNIFEVIPQSSYILLKADNSIITFVLDYECSGFIETAVFLSILIFFPKVSLIDKLKYLLFGICFIIVANIIRITFICLIIKLFGKSFIYVSHTVFARILFFTLIIWLYYTTFTKLHLKYQQVSMNE